MLKKSSKLGKFDLLKEMIWTLLIGVAAFAYWVALLLAITFVFNSIIRLSFETILLISIILSLCVILYRVIQYLVRLEK